MSRFVCDMIFALDRDPGVPHGDRHMPTINAIVVAVDATPGPGAVATARLAKVQGLAVLTTFEATEVRATLGHMLPPFTVEKVWALAEVQKHRAFQGEGESWDLAARLAAKYRAALGPLIHPAHA